jgi:hypothetical protein
MATPQSQSPVACKVCERGELLPKKIFRMSVPVVVIGFIFLIPSILGMSVGALLLIAIAASRPLGIVVGAPGFIATLAIIIGVPSFVGGLLGWLLVMKKRVLQCSVCGAVISAS